MSKGWLAEAVADLLVARMSGAALAQDDLSEPTHAGVAVQAADTGRILMIQRKLDQDDEPDVRGTWEWPGGGIEEGDGGPEAAAWREFSEETGLAPPPGETSGGWRSPDGVYQGYLFVTPVEADAFEHGINPPAEHRVIPDPDNPECREPDVQAWFTREQIEEMGPAVRPEVRESTDWTQFLETPKDGAEMPETETPEDTELSLGEQAREMLAKLPPKRSEGEDESPPRVDPDKGQERDDVVEDPDEEDKRSRPFADTAVPWHGVLAPEGVRTGDGRRFLENSLDHRPLPLPLTWQKTAVGGHDGNVTIAKIEKIKMVDVVGEDGETVRCQVGAGHFIQNAESEELIGLVGEFGRFGVSIDADDTAFDLNEDEDCVDFSYARSSAACVVSIPAFHQAWVSLGEPPAEWGLYDEDEAVEVEALVASGAEVPDPAEVFDLVALEKLAKTEDGPGWLTHPVDTDRLRDYWVRGAGAGKIGWGTPGDFNRCRALLAEYVKPQHLSGYCFTGDTEFLTRDGVTTFAEVVGTTQHVLTAPEPLGRGASPVSRSGYWVEAPIEDFGEQAVLSVTLRRGRSRKIVRATREHEWFASADARSAARKRARKLRTEELEPGMALASLMPQSLAKRRSEPSAVGIAAGMTFGDGYAGPHGASVDLWGEKDAVLLPYFSEQPQHPRKIEKSGLLGVRITGLPRSWKSLPALDEGFSYLMGWLAGYIAADGTVGKTGAIQLASAKREHLEHAAVVANRLGISTLPISERMRLGTGVEETALYKMTFVGDTFPASMLIIPEHRRRFEEAAPSFSATRWVVESVEDHGEVERVYCAVVPETETFALSDYIWVHNCANRHYDALGIWPGQHSGQTERWAYKELEATSDEPAEALSLVAGGGRKAPAAWFADPGFAHDDGRLVEFEPGRFACPLTVTEEGHVYGHLAAWDVCHIGFKDYCQTAPQSATEYAWFRSGGVLLDDGTTAATGVLSIGGGHAGSRVSVQQALAHYDSTSTAVADVAAGEDEFGIWVSGWVRPGATDDMVTALRASALSGDWREIPLGTGQLELVAALAVNVPGFGIPRTSVGVKHGSQRSLVAAGIVPPADEVVEKFKAEIDVPALAMSLVMEVERIQELKAKVSDQQMRWAQMEGA